MPYNIDKKHGGDNPSNTSWMEKCVGSIKGNNKRTGKPYTKSEKIAICKSQLQKKKSKSEEEVILDMDVVEAVECAMANYANILYKQGKAQTVSEAYRLAEAVLVKNDYNINALEVEANKK
jgi:hypothetical protein